VKRRGPARTACGLDRAACRGVIHGARAADNALMSQILILAAAFLAPTALALWAHRVEVRASAKRAPSLFAFAQRAQWAGVLAFVLWVPAILGFHGPRFGSLFTDLGELLVHTPWAGAAIVGPPLLVTALVGLLAHDIALRARLTDWTWRLAWGDAFTLVGGGVSAFTLFFSGIGGIATGQTRIGIVAVLAALVVATAVGGLRRKASGLIPQAITRGALRDRVFALADRAGVRLSQLYVVPFRRFRLANAFAVQGRVVWLTDHLLTHLGRDEVDAVLLHELAHLGRNDPVRISRVLLLVGAGTGVALAFGGWAALVPALPVALLIHLAVLRRIEYATDARAVALGARPEALVTGLARLARLSGVPPRWSMAREWWLTHPSLERRALRVAAAAGADPDAFLALAFDPPEAADPWGVPDEAAAPRAFSSEFRRGALGRAGWALVFVSVLVPAVVIAALRLAATHGFEVPRLAGLLLATAAAFATWLAAIPILSHGPMRMLRRAIEARLAVPAGGTAAGSLDGSGHATRSESARFFVGLSPGAEPRFFEGFAEWDAGGFDLAPGAATYAGEEARFSLTPSEVRDVRPDGRLPGWMRIPTIRVDWARGDGLSGTFGLVPVGASHPFAVQAEARRLRAALDAWRSGSDRAGAGLRFGPPPTEAVTGTSPRALVQPPAIVLTWILQVLLAFASSLAFGFPAGFTGAGAIDVACAAIVTQVLVMLPFLRYREPVPAPAEEPRTRIAA